MSEELLASYLQRLADVVGRGDAREESYYPALKTLLESFANETDRDEAAVTVLPAQTEAGSPDVRVWDGRQHITGYVEAKRPGTDLDEVEDGEQLDRYRSAFPNLILTDFCEFRLYRDGDCVLRSRAARSYDLTEQAEPPAVEEGEETAELLERFFGFSVPQSYDAESLATELARRTRFLRDVVLEQLEAELDADEGRLPGFYEAFQEYLIAGLDPQDFADLYAQTLTYGLFAARVRAEGEEFTRTTAADHIPRSIGVLHEIFEFISYQDVPEALAWIVDDIAEVLAVADAGGILDRYYREGKGTDPVVHFYETFLAEYDPEERERRGVYYTPEPVVGYIVRSLHKILKEEFGKADGLASDGVTLLDPAAGTMTFVARATREAAEEFAGKYGEGAVEGFLTEHVLENFYAFELMMAPYAVGHLKMSFLLEEMGHRLGEDERFQLYLTNTLEMERLDQTKLPGLKPLAEESDLAGEVKEETPILVVLGNPPYSGHSSNKGGWIRNRIDDYKEVDGEPLGERNPKWLQDDYVKFLRFAEWKIDREGEGIVGMITNHSWLDNPTFRGMRWHLLQTYDEIRVLDLHGNSLKRETTPEGDEDENVFDIRQGVAISILVKQEEGEGQGPATVHHEDVWGMRDDKYDWLETHDVETTDWSEITPQEEFYLYVPRDEAALERYNEFPKVTDIFPVNSVSIVTSRDGFVIDFDRTTLEQRVQTFRDTELTNREVREALDLTDSNAWKLAEKRPKIQADDAWREKITRVLYRPFDERWIFYHYHAIDRGREDVMQHMLMGENLALVTNRQVRAEGFRHALASRLPTDFHTLETAHAAPYHFPLYIYRDRNRNDLFGGVNGDDKRRPNLSPRLLPVLEETYGLRPAPLNVFRYVYAVLYADSYREKYADFLGVDFPRIPFTSDPDLFDHLADLGERLIDLHLLDSAQLADPIAQFHGEGNNEVARLKRDGFRYDVEWERKYINENQYFAPIPLELWQYQIGGYQVPRKWLKDRKERKLSTDEIRTYCRIVTAIQKTIEIQEEIDALYPEAEADVIEMNLAD